MKKLKGDLLTVKKGYICHQVNVEGVMGAGIALQIKRKWPEVYEQYKSLCGVDHNLLGNAQIISVVGNCTLNVINLFGQRLNTGYERPTRYDAVADAFKWLYEFALPSNGGSSLYIPRLMGCDRGGGEWPIYLSIVTHYFPQVNVVDYEQGKEVYDPKNSEGWHNYKNITI